MLFNTGFFIVVLVNLSHEILTKIACVCVCVTWCGEATRLGKERKGGDPTAVVPKELSSEKFLVGIGSKIQARLAIQGCNLHFDS